MNLPVVIIGNTLHNYSVLADDRSVLLGTMCNNIQIGSYAYYYLCNTSSRMDLNYLQVSTDRLAAVLPDQ